MTFLCWLGFHSKRFRYRSRPTEEKEYRNVEVVCKRCGMIFERMQLLVDNDGNVDGPSLYC